MSDNLLPLPSFEELRSRLADLPGDPGRDADDFKRVAQRARAADLAGEELTPVTELRVRLAGGGVDGHYVPVHQASQLLDLLQGTITAIGSAVRKRDNLQTPKNQMGRRVGVKEATEFRFGPEVAPGSLIFHLVSSPKITPTPDATLPGTGQTDGLVDVAVRQLFDVLRVAETDEGADIGDLTETIRRYGSMVASKLSQLAKQSLAADIDLDLGHWSRSGSRGQSHMSNRGANAIRVAAERNKHRTEPETLTGRLRTVSDGVDHLRLTRDDDTTIRIAVDPDLGLTLGPLLGKSVILHVSTDVKWQLTTGREVRTRHLVSAELAPLTQPLV